MEENDLLGRYENTTEDVVKWVTIYKNSTENTWEFEYGVSFFPATEARITDKLEVVRDWVYSIQSTGYRKVAEAVSDEMKVFQDWLN